MSDYEKLAWLLAIIACPLVVLALREAEGDDE